MAQENKSQFHTFYSNSYEALRVMLERLAGNEWHRGLADSEKGGPAPGFFRRIPVIVPSRAVEADLTHYFADRSRCGVASFASFELIGDWFSPVSGTPLGRSSRANELEWLIWERLRDEAFLAEPECAGLLSYLSPGGVGSRRPDSDPARYELALRIAAAFTKYSTYRFDWIERWSGKSVRQAPTERARREEEGFKEAAPVLGWQQSLWRWLGGAPEEGGGPRWRGMDDLARLARMMDDPLSADLPDPGLPLHIFAPTGLPPLVLPFLYAKSLRDPVYLYLLNPSTEYWFDPSDWRAARSEEGPEDSGEGRSLASPHCSWLMRNALQTRALVDRVWRLTTAEAPEEAGDDSEEPPAQERLGAKEFRWDPARPLQDLVVSVEDPETRVSVDPAALAGRGGSDHPLRRTLLDAVHEAVFRNNEDFLTDGSLSPAEAAAYRATEKGLPSVRIAAASSLKREVEALADWIYALRERGVKASEILVATPNISAAAPVIDSVFSALPQRIDYAVSGRSVLESSSAAEAFGELCDFLYGRGAADAFYAFVSLPLVSELWGFSGEDQELLRAWLSRAGYRYGISESHIGRLLEAGLASDEGEGVRAEGTLARAVERLALGFAADAGEDREGFWEDVRPASGSSRSWLTPAARPELFKKLLLLSEALDRAQERLFETETEGASPECWEEALLQIEEELFPEKGGWWASPDTEELKREISSLCRTALRALAGAGSGSASVPFAVLRSAFTSRMESASRAARPDGRVVFTSMEEMRGIPFRAIAALGLDSDSGFPGTPKLDEFDLMGFDKLKRRGDRDSRRDNRNVFFDLAMAARDYFAVFYKEGENREKRLPPSEVVTDFDLFLEKLNAARGGKEPFWRFSVPQTAYSPRCFSRGALELCEAGSLAEAFVALKEREDGAARVPEPFADRPTPLAGREFERRVLPLSTLCAYLNNSEREASRLAGFAESSVRMDPKPALDFSKKDRFLEWAFKSEARASSSRGVSRELFLRVRKLDPLFGAKPVRGWQLDEKGARIFKFLDAAEELVQGRVVRQTPPLALSLPAGTGGLRCGWTLTAESQRLFCGERGGYEAFCAALGEREALSARILALFLSAQEKPVPLTLALLPDDKKDGKSQKKGEDSAAMEVERLAVSPEDARKALGALTALFEAAADEGLVLKSRHQDYSPFFRTEARKGEDLAKAGEELRKTLKKFLAGGEGADVLVLEAQAMLETLRGRNSGDLQGGAGK